MTSVVAQKTATKLGGWLGRVGAYCYFNRLWAGCIPDGALLRRHSFGRMKRYFEETTIHNTWRIVGSGPVCTARYSGKIARSVRFTL